MIGPVVGVVVVAIVSFLLGLVAGWGICAWGGGGILVGLLIVVWKHYGSALR